jgi:Spy/CpxP family protein refolding chaperone
MKKTMCFGFLVLLFLGSSFSHGEPAAAEGKDRGQRQERTGEGRLRAMKEEFMARLGLSEEQKKQLEENRQKNMSARKELVSVIRADKEALNEELLKPELDMARINAIHAEMKTAQARIADQRLDSILEVRKILTAEQFRQFVAEMKEKRGARKYQGKP